MLTGTTQPLADFKALVGEQDIGEGISQRGLLLLLMAIAKTRSW